MAWSVDRENAMAAFQEYAGHYNLKDDMIRLKAEHTYRVARLCEQIAQSLELSEKDVDLAWLIGRQCLPTLSGMRTKLTLCG